MSTVDSAAAVRCRAARTGACSTVPCHRPTCRSGADPGLRSDDNELPAELAEASGLEEIANLLNQRQQLKRLQSSNSSRRQHRSPSSAGCHQSPPFDGERRGRM